MAPVSTRSLQAFHQLADGHFETAGESFDCQQAGLLMAVFNPRNCFPLEAAFGGEIDLAPTAGLAELADALAEPEADVGHADSMHIKPSVRVIDASRGLLLSHSDRDYTLRTSSGCGGFMGPHLFVVSRSLRDTLGLDSSLSRNLRHGVLNAQVRACINSWPGPSWRRPYRHARARSTKAVLSESGLPAGLHASTCASRTTPCLGAVLVLKTRALFPPKRNQSPC